MKETQALIAAWVLKTIAVLQYVHRQRPIAQKTLRALYETHRAPDEVYVWTACAWEIKSTPVMFFQRPDLRVAFPGDPPGDAARGGNMYFTTLRVGHFVACVPRRWRILEPAEVARVARAFTDEQARAVFLTLILTGVRRFELQGLRWRDVDLLDGVLRVRQSKSEAGERSIALSATLRDVLSDPTAAPRTRETTTASSATPTGAASTALKGSVRR